MRSVSILLPPSFSLMKAFCNVVRLSGCHTLYALDWELKWTDLTIRCIFCRTSKPVWCLGLDDGENALICFAASILLLPGYVLYSFN